MIIVIFRALILYILIMFCIRLMGKRQLGELQPSELVITILISNIASLPIEDTSIPIILGAIPVIALVSFEIFISNISLKSKKVRYLMSGRPVIIISNGEIDQKQMKKLRFSIDDLMESLRQNKIFDIRDVEYAIVETTGKVSILEKFDAQSITPKMMDIKGFCPSPPTIVISDCEISCKALSTINITKGWIENTISENNLTLNDIFMMIVDEEKNYHIIKKQR